MAAAQPLLSSSVSKRLSLLFARRTEFLSSFLARWTDRPRKVIERWKVPPPLLTLSPKSVA